jgi:hypothetical protein
MALQFVLSLLITLAKAADVFGKKVKIGII